VVSESVTRNITVFCQRLTDLKVCLDVDWLTPLPSLMSAKETVLAPVVEGTTDLYGMLWSLVAEWVCALGRPSVLAFSLAEDAVIVWSVLRSASAAPLS
jgi:hypothetical protein